MRIRGIQLSGMAFALALVGALAPGVPLATGVVSAQASGGFNSEGNLLISDQFNNRAIEINRHTREIVWSFGTGNPTACNPGPGAIIGLNDAERLSDGLTLMVGTGVPQGASPADPNFSCVDNRTIVVDRHGEIVWQYGQAGVTGSGPNELNVPVFAIQLPNRNIMIVDQGNNRVIEVDRFTRNIVWSYPTSVSDSPLNNPNSAELLPNGHVLIADENNNRVIEVTRQGNIVWQYGSGDPNVTTPLDFAAFASRLPNGDTLITDSGHSRIAEVTRDGQVVFEYFTNTARNSNPNPLPTNAVRLENGSTSIADQFNHRAIVVSRSGRLLFQYGVTNDPGNQEGLLDGPYTSFSIGDYTGQTVPPKEF